jgi:phosphohistidine phosphatase
MRRLLLLRHAKTERAEPGEHDRDRKLTAHGRGDAPILGAYMARHGLVPDLVLVSPAARAEETWDLVSGAFTRRPKVLKEERIYNAATETLIELVREADDAATLLVVGHNPGLQDLALGLIASGDVDTRERLAEKFPTCGLAVIELPLDNWSRLHVNSGRLERFVSPSHIAAATD